jgi:ligand-binding sensor domain-containing protein
MVRTFDWSTGFPASYTTQVQQDRAGFLWVSSPSGLILFDGTRSTIVHKETVELATTGQTGGRIAVTNLTAHTFEARPSGLIPLDADAPDQHPNHISAAVATDGTPWRARDGVVEYLTPRGTWTRVPFPTGGDPPLRAAAGREGRMYVASRSTIWVVSAASMPRAVGKVDNVLSLFQRADGTLIAGANQAPDPVTTRVFNVAGGRSRLLYEERSARLLGIAERGDSVWISMDTALQGIGPSGELRGRLAPPSLPATGGAVFADREGSLWLATPGGLVQIPDPDVWAVAPPSEFSLRQMVRSNDGVWATFWGSLLFIGNRVGEPQISILPGPHYSGLCNDGAARVWTGPHVGRLTPPMSYRPLANSEVWDPLGCNEGNAGRRWIASGTRTLWSVGPDEPAPRRVSPLPDETTFVQAVTEDRDSMLWLGVDSRVCRVPATALLAGASPPWTCEDTRLADGVNDLHAMPSGDLWALTPPPARLLRRAGGRWEDHPGFSSLPSGWPVAIEPSPKGGVWIVGFGFAMRVGERRDLPDGWEVLETLTAWQGLTWINVSALIEDADGTLWLGADAGIVRIPAHVRNRRPEPPAVALVESSVDGARLDSAAPIRLPFRRNRLEASPASITFPPQRQLHFPIGLTIDLLAE